MSGLDIGGIEGHPAYQDQMERLRAMEKAREQEFMADFRLAAKGDPALVGEAQQLAQKLGAPLPAVEADIKTARAAALAREIRYQELARSHPQVLRSLQDVQFKRLAPDDLQNLLATDSIWQSMSRKFAAGQAVTERGYIGSRIAAGVSSYEQEAGRLAELDAVLRNAADDGGFLAGSAEIVGQMSETVPKALAAGAGAGLVGSAFSPAAGAAAFTYGTGTAFFAQTAAIEGGSTYLELVSQGVPHEQARAYGLVAGLFKGGLELVGARAVALPFKAAAGHLFAKTAKGLTQETAGRALVQAVTSYGKAMGAEVSTEVLQEVTDIVTEAAARQPGQPEPTWGEVGDRLYEIAAKTAQGMALLALPGPTVQFLTQKQQAERAIDRAAVFERASERAAESKVRQRNPEAYAAFAQNVAESHGVQDVYIDSEKFVEALAASGLTREDVRAEHPAIFQQLEKAEANADIRMDIVVRSGDFQAKLVKTKLGDALMPHLRFDQDGMSMEEAQAWIASEKDLAKQAASLLPEKREADEAFATSAKAVEASIYEQITATGRIVDLKERRSAAAFYRDFVVTQAARRGITPEEFHARYPLSVAKGEGQEGARFKQAGKTDTPEFLAWFGKSVVPDVMHHGSGEAEGITVFDEAQSGGLFWFTPSADIARTYADNRSGRQGGGSVTSGYLRVEKPLDMRTAAGRAVIAGLDPEFASGLTNDNDRATAGRIIRRMAGSDSLAWHETKDARASDAWTTIIVPQLQALGYDGLVMADAADTGAAVAVFDSRQIKSVNNRGTFDPSDPNILRAGEKDNARGGFLPDKLLLLLNEKADASTFLHESAHAFLTIYSDLAAQGDAMAAADLQILLDWFGVKDAETWHGMTLEQQRKHHEAFAYSFEGYLFDGKAPSRDLQGLFDRFKVWLRRIYKTIRENIGAVYRQEFGEELPILTGEVRQVMDRMLASEDAIAEAEAVRAMVPLFQTQEQSGMDPETFAAYQELAREAREAGVEALDADSLRQMQWLDGARSRILKAKQAEHAETRAKVRREVVAEVAARPAVRADRWLRTGKMLNEDGTTAQGDKDQNHKLDRLAALLLVAEDSTAAQKLEPYLRGDGGLDPDATAEQFGYDTGEAMIRDLMALRPFGEAVDARTNERMLAEHSELADPQEVEAAVDRALHNEARARFVAAELRHLQGATQPVRVMLAAAKEAAKKAIEGMAVREVSAKQFSQAEARAARMAHEAMRKGKSAEAAEWQQKRLLQHALATVAGEFQVQRDKDLRNLARFQRPDDKLAKSRDTDLVNAARWILSRYNLGTPNQEASATRAIEAISKYDKAMAAQLMPLLADADQNARDYRDLTVEQFRDLMAKVDGLWNDARRSQQIRVDGQLMERHAVRELLLEQFKKSNKKAARKGQPIRKMFGSVAASLRHVESWALQMDGGQPGPVHKYLFQLLREPVNDFLLERTQMVNEIDAALRKLPALYGRKYEAKHLRDKDGNKHVFQNRGELVGFLLHAGNLDNMRIDAVGRGWVQKAADPDAEADLGPVFREIQRLVDDGHLTKADFDFVQSVWDTFENRLKGRAQQAHKDNFGFYFTEIEAAPLTVRFKDGEVVTYRGGYMPAKADRDEQAISQPGQVSLDGVTEAGGEFMNRHPSAPKGFTITRTGHERALAHDVRLIAQAFSEELQFIHLQRPGRDLASLLNDREIGGAIQGIDADALRNMFFPWLQDTMRNRLMAPGGDEGVNRFLVAARRNVGIAYMFGNVANAFQQLTGFATTATYVPLKHLRAGFKLAWQTGSREQMLAESKFMRLRIDKRLGQITDDIDVILKPTWLGNAQKWTRKNGYFLQQLFQTQVDVVTWLGAKDQAIAQGKTNAQAVAWADSVVRRSQGSGAAADISRLERSGAVVRLLTQFSGFWMTTLNSVLQREGAEQVKATAVYIAFAGVAAGAITQGLKGGWEDDDEDGALWDDVAGWAVGEAVRTGAAMVPIAGPAALTWVTGDRGGRLSPAAVTGAADQGFRGIQGLIDIAQGKRDAKGQDIKDLSLFLSIWFGVPLTLPARPASYQFDVSRGNVQPSSVLDHGRGLVTGTPAPGTR